MRLFEILLVFSCFALLSDLWFYKSITRKTSTVICMASSIILIVQLCFEGYRWQLVFVYIMAVLLVCAVLFRRSKNTANLKMWRPLKYGFYSLTIVLIGVSICLSLYLPVFNLPKPDGLYEVGTQTLHFIDDDRAEIFTENHRDKRELMVQVWYPAGHVNHKKSSLLFPEDKTVFKKYMQAYSQNFKLPEFAFDYWRYIRSNSYEDAEIRPTAQPYPLVLISHGMGTGRVLHTSQAENLASHGFIVAAIDHTYSTTATAFPDGRVTGFETVLTGDNFYDKGSRIGKVWTQDVKFVISRFKKMNSGSIRSIFEGKVDVNNIGMMGHSFGGATAFNALYLNDDIRAGINMDGTLYELKNREHINKPFLFMQAGDFIDNVKKYKNKKGLRDKIANELSIMENVKQHEGSVIYVEGAAHYNFTDLQLFSDLIQLTGMTGKINGKRGAFITNQYVLDFFNKHLKESGGNLVDEPNAQYPEVKFQ